MTESLVPVSGKTTTIISESPQARGPSNLSPNDKRLRTKPGAKSAAEAEFHRAQLQAVYENIADCGTDHDTEGKYSARLADVETFLERLKTKGIVDRKGGGHLAKMTQEQKKELLTLGLKRHSGTPEQRENARRAICVYADYKGYDGAQQFKEVLLARRPHWINGQMRSVDKRPFKLLGETSNPDDLDLKAFEPENLLRTAITSVLGERLKSAKQNHPTLANVDRHLSLEDLTALNDSKVLFSKDGGNAPIRTLLHVAVKGWNGVSYKEDRQKIRDVMLLATAKEATAAKAENRGLDLRKLVALKMELLTAGQRGPKQLAKRYNEEMAKLAFQPGTPDAPWLGEIDKTSADAKTYRAEFQASVEKWSKDNGHRFIAVPKLQELSRMATASIFNKRKLDAYMTELKNGQVADLQGKPPAFQNAYVKQLKFRIENEGNKKGVSLDDRQFQVICKGTLKEIQFQDNIHQTLGRL